MKSTSSQPPHDPLKQEAGDDTLVQAFGQSVVLRNDPGTLDAPRRIRELREDYEYALASRSIPKSGRAVDVGAGVGWFAIPFALAFPDWEVIALEPDATQFELLEANARSLGAGNLRCINAAFHPDAPALDSADDGNAPETLLSQPGEASFVALSGMAPRLAPAGDAEEEGEIVKAPALPTSALAAMAPDIVKLDAPFCEPALAAAIRSTPVHLVLGQLYENLPSSSFHPGSGAGAREFYLRHGTYALRRDYEDNFATRRAGLDIVVAMYNTSEFIVECVDSLLADGNPEIRVLVVDDGSTDDCADIVVAHYGDNDRVRLLRKANGGCASARNFGRVHSDATHIAFLDADDRVDEGMFTALLETARYTGAYVVEGEFVFLDMEEDGSSSFRDSYEAALYDKPGTHQLGANDFLWLKERAICYGQPTIWRRVHRRDFLDLYLLSRKLPLDEMLARSPEKYGHVRDFPLQALKGLADVTSARDEPMPTHDVELDWQDVEKWLLDEIRRLARNEVGLPEADSPAD